MLWWVVLAACWILLGLLLFVHGRRNESSVMRSWEMVLTSRGQQELGVWQAKLGAELETLEIIYDRARDVHALGRDDEALRLLECGCRLIESYCPSMLRALSAWSELSRMAAAIAPVKPLRPADFRLPELAQLARLSRFFHHFLVTTGERFRLRLYILARG